MNNTLLELIQGTDVEWKALSEILTRTKGTKITAKQMKELNKSDGSIKIFAGGKTVAFVNHGDIPEKDILREASIIVKSRGIIEFEYYDKPFSHKSEMWSYHSEDEAIEIKYIYYFLKMNEKYFQNLGSKMQMPQIATPDTDRYKIPIPSLEIQQKVVEILDKMTDYVTELTAELTLRQKQYSYYRDKLLTFGTEGNPLSESEESVNVKWKTLLECCDYVDYRGKTPKKVDSGIFLVTAKNIRPGYIDYDKSSEFISEEDYENVMRRGYPKIGDILITTEAPMGNIAQIDRENIALAQRVIKYRPKNSKELNSTFLKHYLLGKEFQVKLNAQATGGTVKGIKGSRLHQMTVPIPPLNIQNEIVKVLDKFEKLVSDLTEGLPREIGLRQEQYEYWRGKLMNFKIEN